MSEQKRLIVFFVISAAVLFVWQSYFAPVLTPISKTSVGESQDTSYVDDNSFVATSNESIDTSESVDKTKASHFTLENNNYSIVLDNYLNIVDVTSSQAVFTYREILGRDSFVGFEFKGNRGYEKRFFDLKKTSDTQLSARFNNTELNITLADNGNLSFVSTGEAKEFRFVFKSNPKELENGQLRKFVYFTKDFNDVDVGKDKSSEHLIKWFGLDFNYHLLSFVYDTNFPASIKTTVDGFLYVTPAQQSEMNFNFIFAKKEYNYLTKMGNQLNMAVDFGFWGIIAVPILHSLQFFYKYFPNYGISIIILTILIRLLTFPLTYKSFKSMKKMQQIQPELTKLKEKYKDEPQRMQKETMALFKRAGANPLSGCLPLLLQMPIFFAFYKVLFTSVELVDAPFILWIKDLSNKDPYYVLPFLMAVSMFLQQKITPTAVADPMQKKIMLFMPVVFALIMKDMPAGLSLYIFVSTIFGIAQQVFVYKKA